MIVLEGKDDDKYKRKNKDRERRSQKVDPIIIKVYTQEWDIYIHSEISGHNRTGQEHQLLC